MQQVTVNAARWSQDSEGAWLCLRVKSPEAAMEVCDALKQGKSVRLGTLGSFRPTIAVVKSREHEEDVSASDIKFLRCRFTPSGKMARSLMMKELKFKLLKGIGAAVGGKEVGNA